ncbi:MAG: hypothetical protein Q8O76_10240 [Chloroflexota bacterium]|nr:hypothetical protein [Chloroflexota bacterium]
MGGIRGSQRLVTVTAKCGHKVTALVYPGYRIGYAGRRNIAEAQSNACVYCRQFPGQKFIALIETEMGGHAYSSSGAYGDVVQECREMVAEDARFTDTRTGKGCRMSAIYVLPLDEETHPLGDADFAGEYWTWKDDAPHAYIPADEYRP